MMKLIHEIFNGHGSMKHIDATFITLIPKSTRVARIKDYHMISGVNTIYKIVSNIIVNRLAEVAPDLLSFNHSAFTERRLISNNILQAEEHLRGFNQKV